MREIQMRTPIERGKGDISKICSSVAERMFGPSGPFPGVQKVRIERNPTGGNKKSCPANVAITDLSNFVWTANSQSIYCRGWQRSSWDSLRKCKKYAPS